MYFNIYVDNDKNRNISVFEEVRPGNETKKLLEILDENTGQKIHITFYNASIFHADIVMRLNSLQNDAMCKVTVMRRYLHTYLSSLGIRCEYIPAKPLKKSDPEESLQFKEEEVPGFLESIYAKYGYDYREYELGSIIRRIKMSMLRESMHDFKKFNDYVLNDHECFEQLFLDFSINTTAFFRDPDVFLELKNKVLPYLDSYANIKIWCVGCSNGKEAYSLAILLDELGMLDKTQIYATDINPFIIEEARNGLYPLEQIDTDIKNYQAVEGRGNFIDHLELKGSYVKVKSHLQKNILFFQHSLVGSGSLNEFQLIMCRNVLIYFKPALQEKVLENFYNSIDMSGFLILGKSEGMLINGGYSYFVKYDEREKIYRPR